MSDSIHEDIDLDGLTRSYQSEDQLVVALDFGTTFSGIAYAFANGSKPALISIEDWPGKMILSIQMIMLIMEQDSRDISSPKSRLSSATMRMAMVSPGVGKCTKVRLCKE